MQQSRPYINSEAISIYAPVDGHAWKMVGMRYGNWRKEGEERCIF